MQRFLSELKRRHVHRVAVGYAAICWMVIEIADVVFPVINAPSGSMTFLLVVSVIGFPVAIVLGWIFDITNTGIIRTEPVAPREFRQLSLPQVAEVLLFTLLVGVIAFLVVERQSAIEYPNDAIASRDQPISNGLQGKGNPFPSNSIGVLPFENFSDDPANTYFGDGIAEELLNSLANTRGLRVASRTSAFYFKDQPMDLAAIATRLGVRFILEGSVRESNDRMRVTAQLIDASTGYHLWSETYDHETSDLLDIQDSIAREVISEIRPMLVSNYEKQKAYKTPSRQAYNSYLQARHYMRMPMTKRILDKAYDAFNEAIQLDRRFVQAYAGLCDVALFRYTHDSDIDSFSNAQEACTTALVKQSGSNNSWEVHLSLGELYREAGRFEDSLDHLNQALALNDTRPGIHVAKARTFAALESFDAALASFERAKNLDPYYWDAYLVQANYFYSQRQYEAAINQYDQVLAIIPGYVPALIGLGSALYQVEDQDGAIKAWLEAEEHARETDPGSLGIIRTNVGILYYYRGEFDKAMHMQKLALEVRPDDHKLWGRLAEASRGAGDRDTELKSYQSAISLANERLKINPEDWEALSMLAVYYSFSGDEKNTDRILEELDTNRPTNPNAYYFAALSRLPTGNYDAAFDYLEQAVEMGFEKSMIAEDPDLLVLSRVNLDRYQRLAH